MFQNLGPSLAQIANFSQKVFPLVNLNVTSTYLLHPFMLVNISQISNEWIIKYEVA